MDCMTDQDFDFIRALFQERTAIALESDKRYLVEARLAPLLRQLQLQSIGELVQQMRSAVPNGLPGRIVDAMVTTETSFFRDHHPFEALRKKVLPELIERRGKDRRLNIWVRGQLKWARGVQPGHAGARSFPQLAGWDLLLLASDLSQEVLRGAGRPVQPDRGQPRLAGALAGQVFPAARRHLAVRRKMSAHG